ncbi:putative Trypanosome variant surface glycoprotein (A type) [Trypanosoma vivax]|nr:putative Trypanosome variant surface glycoprotein (A type) [Trypanosoma vivax]
MGRRRGIFLACFALLCHLLPGVVAGDKAIGKTNSALVCAGSSALKGAANKLLDDAAAGLQKVWHMDLATAREEEKLARVQMCTGTERREGIVKAVSSRIKDRREKVALARNASEEAMQAARDFAKFAYHVAGGIDAFMLTLATYSAGAHTGKHNARCLNNDPEGTSAETYQAGTGGGKSEEKINAMLALIAECRTEQERRTTVDKAKTAIRQRSSSHRSTARKTATGLQRAETGRQTEGAPSSPATHEPAAITHFFKQPAAASHSRFTAAFGQYSHQERPTMASSYKSHKTRKREIRGTKQA